MVKERCWRCTKMRNDLELCATDDRLCQSCFRKNGEELKLAHKCHNTNVTTRSSGKVGAITRTTDSTKRWDDDAAEQSTSKEVCQEDVSTGRSPSPLIGHQSTIIQREDVTAAGKSPSIESQTTSSTVHQECVTTGIKPMIKRQDTNDDRIDSNGYHQQI